MGSNNTPMDMHPRFGFTEQQSINQTLSNGTLTGTAVMRVAGLRTAIAMGIFTLTAGAGEVSLILEGSNDGTNWFTLSQTAATEYFTTNGQVQILNALGSGEVDLEHFQWFRVRAAIISGAPTFSMQVIVTGISNDCEKFLRSHTFGPRLGLTPTVQSSTPPIVRPAGTLLTNVQVNASGVILGGLTSFDAVLQGSPDGGTTWIDIGTATITASGSQLMLVDTESLFSLGSLMLLRFQVRDNGVATGATAFEAITLLMTLDSCDWVLLGGASSGGSFDPSEVFLSVSFGAPGAEVGDTIAISFQIFDADGAPLLEARKLELILYDTSQAGDNDLALTATFSAVGVGTAIDGLTTNRLVLTTDASGAGTISVLDAAAETVYLTAVNHRGPQTVPQLIAAATEASLVFA